MAFAVNRFSNRVKDFLVVVQDAVADEGRGMSFPNRRVKKFLNYTRISYTEKAGWYRESFVPC